MAPNQMEKYRILNEKVSKLSLPIASKLLREYLDMYETSNIFDCEKSQVRKIFDEKLSNTLGYDETIFNHSSEEDRISMLCIMFNGRKLSTLDKVTIHKLYRNLLNNYRYSKEDMEDLYERNMQDMMNDFVISNGDIEVVSKEVSWMRETLKKPSNGVYYAFNK